MTVMIVDSNFDDNEKLFRMIKKLTQDCWILSFDNAKEALRSYQNFPADIVFLDEKLRDIDWFWTAQAIQKINPSVNIILTVEPSRIYEQWGLELFRIHGSGYVEKPVTEVGVQNEMNHLRFPLFY